MPACPSCGRPMPAFLLDGRLMATEQPTVIYWQGIALDLSGAKARLMAALIRRETLSHAMIEAIAGGANTAKVHICNLRRILRAHAIPVTIICERGWGYRLGG